MENIANFTEFKHSYELTFEEMYSVCRFYERKMDSVHGNPQWKRIQNIFARKRREVY